MITIWKQNKDSIVKTAMLEKNCWINIVRPDDLEIETIKRDYGIAEDIILDILDPDERSRSERNEGYHAIIFRVPAFSGEAQLQYYTVPLGVIITKDIFITISCIEIDIVNTCLKKEGRIPQFDKPAELLLRLMLDTARCYLRFMKAINRNTDMLEHELQQSVKNTELLKLLRMEKSLVFFSTSLRANELLFSKLEKTIFSNLDEEESELLDDVMIESSQAIEMANIHSNILSGMMDAFASVISNNLNVIMKRLTMVSIVLMIPTFFASVYGMNVPLPFQASPFAFAGILAGSGVLAVICAFIFNTRRMFRKRKE
ncbi:MAG: magnesium transporter CorA family protein [Spirochaetales bacterium]|nr:magnesium transporter CorA family protein [Spirochaetales bacterium]